MRDPDPAPTPRVGVVVLNWNKPELTGRCLDHVLAQQGVAIEVMVVDNGSTPPNRRRLAELCGSRCSLRQLSSNRGFTGGMNAGIRHALRRGFDYVWLLNNDAFPRPDCLGRLAAAMQADGRLAAVTPELVGDDGREQIVGARLDWVTGRQVYLSAAELTPTREPGVTVIGTALLLRVADLRPDPFLDERFFAYREEDDLCFRLTARGRYVAAVRGAVSIHLERASTGHQVSPLVAYLTTRNGWLLLRKHTRPGRRFAAWCRYVSDRLWPLAALRGPSGPIARAEMAGLWDATVGRTGRPGRPAPPRWVEATVRRHGHRLAFWLARLAAQAERLSRAGDRTARGPVCPPEARPQSDPTARVALAWGGVESHAVRAHRGA